MSEESKAKYDWTDVPADVQYLATDEDGEYAWGYAEEPVICDMDGEWACKDASELFNLINLGWWLSGFKGDWRDSLEQRPACTTCPHQDTVCCGGVV